MANYTVEQQICHCEFGAQGNYVPGRGISKQTELIQCDIRRIETGERIDSCAARPSGNIVITLSSQWRPPYASVEYFRFKQQATLSDSCQLNEPCSRLGIVGN